MLYLNLRMCNARPPVSISISGPDRIREATVGLTAPGPSQKPCGIMQKPPCGRAVVEACFAWRGGGGPPPRPAIPSCPC